MSDPGWTGPHLERGARRCRLGLLGVSLLFQYGEGLARCLKDGGLFGDLLIPAHDDVDIERIEFHAPADAARLLGRDQGRAGAEERIEDDVAPVRHVVQRIDEHGDGLHGRVVLEPLPGIGAQGRGARVGPKVRSMPALSSEIDVVHRLSVALLEDGDEFMLRSIKAAHPRIGLRPHDEIELRQPKPHSRRRDGDQAPPVDEGREEADRQDGRERCRSRCR